MNELQTIVTAFNQIPPDQQVALATVVYTAGSVYRRSGARLLITETGKRVGVISGGCLENDVAEQAQSVLATGKPEFVVYDAIANENLLWGLGLGCKGLVQILIEPLSTSHNPLTLMAKCLGDRQTGVLATVFRTEGLTTPIASHLMLYPNGDIVHNLQDAMLIERTIADTHTAFHSRQSNVIHYDFPTGSADLWIEVIQPPIPILIFGAGQDAIPVAQFSKALGWDVTVVDRRPAYANRDRFPMADQIKIIRPENGLGTLPLDSRTAVVLMTHNYFDDRELLKVLLPSAIGYLGLLGPRHRTKQLLEDLKSEGLVMHSSQHHFSAPVGLDIGAETPEAIALSIVAEIQAVLANRTGGALRDRKAPIHMQSEELKCLSSV
jgi:xanthine/CO dehydrogenase XdhC/CoxF family maturation factor